MTCWEYPGWVITISFVCQSLGMYAPWLWLKFAKIPNRAVEIAWIIGQAAWALPVVARIFTQYLHSGFVGPMLITVVAGVGLQLAILDSFMKQERKLVD